MQCQCESSGSLKNVLNINIDEATRKMLCFHEDLAIVSKTKGGLKSCGGYKLSIKSTGENGHEFLVQISSSMTLNSCLAGSKLICFVTEKFCCLEEKRSEYKHEADGLRTKELSMNLDKNRYSVVVEESGSCEEIVQRETLTVYHDDKVISEGANILVQRYLALKNYHGIFAAETITIDGQRASCRYNCHKSRRMKIAGYFLPVYVIQQRIDEECGLIRNMTTYLTQNGQILKHDWLELPYFLKIDSLTVPIVKNLTKSEIPRSSRSNDMEVMSKYIDAKTSRAEQHMDYLRHHPELKKLIADYIGTLLIGNENQENLRTSWASQFDISEHFPNAQVFLMMYHHRNRKESYHEHTDLNHIERVKIIKQIRIHLAWMLIVADQFDRFLKY